MILSSASVSDLILLCDRILVVEKKQNLSGSRESVIFESIPIKVHFFPKFDTLLLYRHVAIINLIQEHMQLQCKEEMG